MTTSPLTSKQQTRRRRKQRRSRTIGNIALGASALIWIIFAIMLAIGAIAFFTTDMIPSYGPLTTAHAQRQCVVQAEHSLNEQGHDTTRIADADGNVPVEIEMSQIGKNFSAHEAQALADNPVFDHRMPITKLYGSRTPIELLPDDNLADAQGVPATLVCVVNMDAAEAAYDAGEVDLDPARDILTYVE